MILQVGSRLQAAARPLADSARAIGDTASADVHRILGKLFRIEDLVVAAFRIALVVIVAFLAYRLVKLVTRRIVLRDILEEDPLVKRQRKQRIETIAALMNNVAATVIVTLAVLTSLNYVGVPIASLLASVGVAGLAISFGAQSLVKDIITGAFIVMEGQYGIGDVIKLGDTSGLVERLTLRTTTLRDTYGTVHTIPNGQITQVSNLTKSWSRAVVDVTVAYREDIDRVVGILHDLLGQLAGDPQVGQLLIGEPDPPGIESVSDSGIVVRLMVKTVPLKQWDVARELRRRIKYRFDAEGIQIPSPSLTFYWGNGQMPPALAAEDLALGQRGAVRPGEGK